MLPFFHSSARRSNAAARAVFPHRATRAPSFLRPDSCLVGPHPKVDPVPYRSQQTPPPKLLFSPSLPSSSTWTTRSSYAHPPPISLRSGGSFGSSFISVSEIARVPSALQSRACTLTLFSWLREEVTDATCSPWHFHKPRNRCDSPPRPAFVPGIPFPNPRRVAAKGGIFISVLPTCLSRDVPRTG